MTGQLSRSRFSEVLYRNRRTKNKFWCGRTVLKQAKHMHLTVIRHHRIWLGPCSHSFFRTVPVLRQNHLPEVRLG